MTLPITYRITRLGIALLKAEKVPGELLQVLIDNEEKHFGSEEKFLNFLLAIPKFGDMRGEKRAKLLEIFRDPFSHSTLNKMRIGELHFVIEGLRIRRIPGGWMFEYYNEIEGSELVSAAVFLNTNDIVDKG